MIKPGLFKSEACVVASRAYGANDVDASIAGIECNLACAFDELLSEASMLRILSLAVKLGDFSVYMHFANHGLSRFDREGTFGFLQLFDLVLVGEREAQKASDAIFGRAAELLHEGAIVAVKGLGGFHLACDARNPEALAELRRRVSGQQSPHSLPLRDRKSTRLNSSHM